MTEWWLSPLSQNAEPRIWMSVSQMDWDRPPAAPRWDVMGIRLALCVHCVHSVHTFKTFQLCNFFSQFGSIWINLCSLCFGMVHFFRRQLPVSSAATSMACKSSQQTVVVACRWWWMFAAHRQASFLPSLQVYWYIQVGIASRGFSYLKESAALENKVRPQKRDRTGDEVSTHTHTVNCVLYHKTSAA